MAESLEVPHIATGDLFRDEVARGTELGKRIEADIDAGKLMPDEDAVALVKAELARDGGSQYVLDGYPRTVPQAVALDSLATPQRVVLLELSDDEAVSRISGRRVCVKCKHAYHLEYHPSKDPKVCDNCGGELTVRGDDKESAIRERLSLYHSVTEPIADYYEAQGKLVRVSAHGTIFEVKTSIHRALGL